MIPSKVMPSTSESVRASSVSSLSQASSGDHEEAMDEVSNIAIQKATVPAGLELSLEASNSTRMVKHSMKQLFESHFQLYDDSLTKAPFIPYIR